MLSFHVKYGDVFYFLSRKCNGKIFQIQLKDHTHPPKTLLKRVPSCSDSSTTNISSILEYTVTIPSAKRSSFQSERRFAKKYLKVCQNVGVWVASVGGTGQIYKELTIAIEIYFHCALSALNIISARNLSYMSQLWHKEDFEIFFFLTLMLLYFCVSINSSSVIWGRSHLIS